MLQIHIVWLHGCQLTFCCTLGIEESQDSRTEIDAEDPEDYFKFLEEEQDDEDTISMI